MLKILLATTAIAIASWSTQAVAAPTVTTEKGYTYVQGNVTFANALRSLNVQAGGLRPAAFAAEQVYWAFPITQGVIDAANARGSIHHSGGIRLSAGSVDVQLRNFIIDTTTSPVSLTGDVIANGNFAGRLPLFNVTLPTLTLPIAPNARGEVMIPGARLSLTAQAAAALNGAFNVTAFAANFEVGTAMVDAAVDSTNR
jgi:Htaa